MADSTFDIVSKVDQMEADNALHQAQKEVAQRYDFKNVGASIEQSGDKVLLKATSEERVKAILEVYDPALGHILGGGGRYDSLIGRFGRDLPAAGFALYVERLHVAQTEEERQDAEGEG